MCHGVELGAFMCLLISVFWGDTDGPILQMNTLSLKRLLMSVKVLGCKQQIDLSRKGYQVAHRIAGKVRGQA